jgi:pimeloyl-ACP methyl ester carboxylesterase
MISVCRLFAIDNRFSRIHPASACPSRQYDFRCRFDPDSKEAVLFLHGLACSPESFRRSGHALMTENPGEFYAMLAEFINARQMRDQISGP